jgi:hypothetical protein
MIMAKFEILNAKALSAALKTRGKAIATFKEREHQLAVSCINHAAENGRADHLNTLLEMTPGNYRLGLINWACEFGNVSYDSKERTFKIAKKKEAKIAASMDIAPADFQKAKNSKPKAAFNQVTYLENALKKLTEEEGVSPAVLRGMKDLLRLAQQEAEGVAPKKANAPKHKGGKVLETVPAKVKGKAVAIKAKAKPETAPVVEAPAEVAQAA